MKLIVKEPFSWAHRGVDIQAYAAGEEIETEDQDLVEVSTHEGWAEHAGQATAELEEQGDKAPEPAPAETVATQAQPDALQAAPAPRAGRGKK